MAALKYYAEVSKAYPELEAIHLPVALAPWIAESTLAVLGLHGHLRYLLKPKGDWHWFECDKRVVVFSGPTVAILDVLHELAHWWSPFHDAEHLCALGLMMGAYMSREGR